MENLFIKGLKRNDLEMIRRAKKSDLHNHGVFGGSIDQIGKALGKKVNPLDRNLNTIGEMSKWIIDQIHPELDNPEGFLDLLEGSIKTAKEEGVVKLEMSIDSGWIDKYYPENIEKFCIDFQKRVETIDDNILFCPELGIKWESDIENLTKRIDYFLNTGYFKCIDLYGEEKAQPVEKFKGIYKKAKKSGLKLKAHVGEFGTPDDIVEVVEKLGITAIQHGISAVESKEVMDFLSKKGITLNICPTSNYMLSRIKELENHPIRELYDNGVNVTINSDDMLIFNSSVSQEYLKLYNIGLFNSKELDEIRRNGLKEK